MQMLSNEKVSIILKNHWVFAVGITITSTAQSYISHCINRLGLSLSTQSVRLMVKLYVKKAGLTKLLQDIRKYLIDY